MRQKIQFFSSSLNAIAENIGYASIALITALTALSFTAILIKLSITEISPNATIFHRLWIASLVLWLWKSIIQEQKPQSEKVDKPQAIGDLSYQRSGLLVLIAVASTASVACWAWSLTQTSVANSTVLRNLTPLFTSLGGWLFLKVKFDRQFILGMILALFGAVAIGWDDLQLGTESLWGDSIALLSAFLYAIYLFAVEHLRNSLNTTTILLWRSALGALFIFPMVLFTEETLFPNSGQGWLILILLAIVSQVIGQGLLVYSLKQFSSGLVAIFLLSQPVLAALLAWGIFAESLTLFNGLAFVLVLGGIYLAQSSDSTAKA
ncbi:DMT(Drug/metabolite transporter) superfamily permease [Hyella patelloides LEGE 07179]|uniref:DMT(Drug/metabolite transporter) superfamily permease n=1 Tax=Hyella patelloides LEGE 07179 TaxID=945734 RepID=A0A563W0Q8_9CYAN|nr:DMT family transporter [Hyella patelloides]VEP17279.1 DMT(Drug/metabolite transporter) superfamily permease [Hyella patelloides LEGE 07179]